MNLISALPIFYAMESTMNTTHPVVSLNQISFSWGDDITPTLQFDHLAINQSEHVFIKGPSGSGKSTLLGLLTGIITPQQGNVSILGTDLTKLKQSERDKFRADHIGYIFQQFNLLPYLSVIENVLLPWHFSTKRKDIKRKSKQRKGIKRNSTTTVKENREQAKYLLNQLHLDPAIQAKPVSQLSIGQQQRVAAARALMGQPELLIADEPTSALDYDNRTAFIHLLMEEAQKANSTLVFVSHDPTLESLFSRSLNLNDINQVSHHHTKEAQ